MKLTLQGITKNKDKESGALQHIVTRLSQNTLTEFKLGFDTGELRSKRDVEKIVKVIQTTYLSKVLVDKYSCLTSIRIGWRLPHFALAPLLQQVLPYLLREPAKIRLLEININTWVPESTMQRIVASNTIQTLVIRSLRIRTRCLSDMRQAHAASQTVEAASAPAECHSTTARTNSRTPNTSSGADESVVRLVPNLSDSIKTLKLIDCGLTSARVEELAVFLRKKRNISSLSLRHNRRVDGRCWKNILALTTLKSLDLSICDMDEFDGWSLCRALHKNHTLRTLSVAGNYRMSRVIPKLVKVGSTRLVELDCSFCDVQNKLQFAIFNILATTPDCTLRSLRMRASRLLEQIEPLLECIRENQSLEQLILDHPHDPSPVDIALIGKIEKAIESNYHLTDFRLDLWEKDQHLLKGMDYWLELNRCGRSVLLREGASPSLPFQTVLARAVAKKNPDMVFWLLKHGSEILNRY